MSTPITDGIRHLIVSDLDGTLIGDDRALREFVDWLTPRRTEVALAYSSGRLFWSIDEAIDQYDLPEPDFVIGGVGTEIRTGAAGDPWLHYCERFTAWDDGLVRKLLKGRFRLRLQPGNVHSLHKVSFFGENITPIELQEIEATLREAGLAVRLVYSSSRDLDVLPMAAGKGEAARFLAQHLEVEPDHLIACGDSGNDLCMLEQAGRAVVVANAFRELKHLEGPTIYHSPHRYAAGVLDGVQYWLEQLDARDSESGYVAERA